MTKIHKSYHFYYVIVQQNHVKSFPKTNGLPTYIFGYPLNMPSFIEQGMCDILPNQYGILFDGITLNQFSSEKIFKDFNSCFCFHLLTDICDEQQNRYKKKYTFHFDVESFKQEISMDLILQYEDSPWKPILEIDPDFFYLKDDKLFLYGSKDYKQVENFVNEITPFF